MTGQVKTAEEQAVIDASKTWFAGPTDRTYMACLAAIQSLIESEKPMRCEPPGDMPGFRFHWLRHPTWKTQVVVERYSITDEWGWRNPGGSGAISSEKMHEDGWLYIGPCVPPVTP